MSRQYDEHELEAAQEFAAGCAVVLSRWRREEAVKRSLALLEALYGEAPVGLGFVDTDLCFDRVNETLASLGACPRRSTRDGPRGRHPRWSRSEARVAVPSGDLRRAGR